MKILSKHGKSGVEKSEIIGILAYLRKSGTQYPFERKER